MIKKKPYRQPVTDLSLSHIPLSLKAEVKPQ
jgi:hypothetical protein